MTDERADTPVRRPRILHLATTDMSLALLLGPQLRALVEAGYEVHGAAAPGPFRAEIEALGVHFTPLRHATRSMAVGEDLLAIGELTRLLRRLRPDLVHTHNPKPGLYGRLASRLARVPVVVNTVHGLYALPEDRPAKRRLVYGLERLASTCSDAELVQNPEDVETLRRIGVPGHRVHLLGNGVDLDRFRPGGHDPDAVAAVRAELADGADTVVGVVGRLVWEKGLAEVFAAAEALRGRHPEARIVVVGPLDPAKSDGLGADDLAEVSARTGIHFAGHRTDMELVYAALDLFVLASHREGFPRAAMEAAATGVPVVATDVRGCRQVVDDGVTGRLVPVRDAAALGAAITELVDDPARRRAMGTAARVKAEVAFDQASVIETTVATYRSLGVAPPGEPTAGRPQVLHVVTTSDRRGAEVSAVQVADDLNAAGVPSRVVALRPGHAENPLPLPSIGAQSRTPATLVRLRRAARRADVVVAHGSDALQATALATVGLRTQFVYRLIGDPAFWADVKLRRIRISWPMGRADAVVAIWPAAADVAAEIHGIDRTRFHVITPKRDADRFRRPTADERAAARAALGVEGSSTVVVYLGALSWEKDPLRAVAAAAHVPDATLLVAGDGPLRAEVDAAVGPADVVLGTVADPRTVLWAADVLLLTSRTEGVPGVVLEAQSCGLPVVATAVGGVPDNIDLDAGALLTVDAAPVELAAAVVDVAARRATGVRARTTTPASTTTWPDLLRGLAR